MHEDLRFLREEGPEAREASFAEFVANYSGAVRTAIANTLRKYAPPASREDVEDLHNGLFAALMEKNFGKLRQFKGRSSLGTFLRVIATRHTIDHLRRQRRHLPLDTEPVCPELQDRQANPQEQLEKAQAELAVQQAIARLQPKERLLLKLVYDRELEPAQVCRTLGITMSGYYNQKSRLVKKLRKLCEKSALGASQ